MLDSETEPPSQLSLRNDLSLSGSWIEDCVMVGGGGEVEGGSPLGRRPGTICLDDVAFNEKVRRRLESVIIMACITSNYT